MICRLYRLVVTEDVVQVAGVVNGKTQIGRVARRELAEDHQLQSRDLPAKVPKRSGEQIEALAWILPAAHRAKQQQRHISRSSQ